MAQAMQVQTAQQLALLSNGSYSTGKGNAQNDYIWDRTVMPATPPSQGIPFFRVPRSGQYGTVSGDAKTDVETSMEDNGKLAAGQNFLTNAICIHLITSNDQQEDGNYVHHADQILHAWKVFMQHSVWSFKFSNTEYSWRTSGVTFLPAVWENGFSAAGQSNEVMVRNGDYQHLSWINMPTKIPITEQVNFTVTAFITSGSANILSKVTAAMAFLNRDTGEESEGNAVQCEVQTTIRGLLTRAL